MSEIDLILGVTDDEAQAFEAFRDKYMQMRPPPIRPGVSGLGWQFWITIPCALAAIVLAALRTANIFYSAASMSGLGDFFSALEAVFAMLAIEGGLVAYAAIRSDRKAKDEDVEAIRQHDTRLGWAIVLMVAVSIIAGLGQSATVVEDMGSTWSGTIQYALFLITGIGASLIAWIGGEVLGSQVALAGIDNEGRTADWRERMDNYMKGLLSSWSRSPERKIVRGELGSAPLKVSESFGNQPRRFPTDWRNLSKDHKKELSGLSVREIVDLADVTERTAYTWRSNLDDEFISNLPKGMYSWDEVKPYLNADQIKWIADESVSSLATIFEVDEGTIFNWRERINE